MWGEARSPLQIDADPNICNLSPSRTTASLAPFTAARLPPDGGRSCRKIRAACYFSTAHPSQPLSRTLSTIEKENETILTFCSMRFARTYAPLLMPFDRSHGPKSVFFERRPQGTSTDGPSTAIVNGKADASTVPGC